MFSLNFLRKKRRVKSKYIEGGGENFGAEKQGSAKSHKFPHYSKSLISTSSGAFNLDIRGESGRVLSSGPESLLEEVNSL